MSMNIDRGLFLLDFSDYHAVLGVPIDADTQTIRKRYLKIARRLHPDSCASESEEDRKRASEFLSKLVNPAWEKLSQEKEKEEYDLLLKLKGQQAARQGNLALGTLGKELTTASNPDHFYRSSLKNLAEKQFEHLDQTLDVIGQISELNIAYLMRKEGANGSAKTTASPSKLYTGSNLPDSSQSGTPPTMPQNAPLPRRETVSDQYYRRAEGYMAKNNLAQAVLELRDALRLEPQNSRCHALLGEIYRRQNQQTMAKIHFNKALEFEPDNELALQGRQRLEKQVNGGKTAGGAKTSAQKQSPKSGKPSNTGKSNDNSGGGLFGLFGGKKK